MKTILSLLLILSTLPAMARDWTYSTNLFSGLTGPTNIFCGTNSTDPDRDTYIIIWNKLNASLNFLWTQDQTAGLTVSNINNLVTGLSGLNTVTNHQSGVSLTGTFVGSFTNGLVTNSIISRGTITNSVATNSTYAGDGFYISNLNGTNLHTGSVNTNAFSSSALTYLHGIAARFPSLTDDGAGHIGVNYTTPGYAIDAVGNGYITTRLIGANNNRAAFLFASQTYGNQYEFGIDSSFSGTHDFYIYDSAMGGFILQIDANHDTYFGNNVIIPAALNSDNGNFYSDGSGNVTAQSFNPVSDRARKENIQSFAPQTALQMALALTNYTWRFKGRTNMVASITRTTNSTANNITATTNLVAKIIPATGKEFGPMAQDWKTVTGLGGGTNISLTSMNGLLLGSVQGLNQKLSADEQHPQIPFYTPPSSASTTFGYGPGLLACDANNLYVSTGMNAWSRINLPTNAW
ncbi:MAG TPA: hypothetical protein VG347_11000 [Verrucomicrobiae bacterium]|nr:hypothetical protein [Verrucomicrobiae bacterium]